VGPHTDFYAHFHRNRGLCVCAFDLLHHNGRNLRELSLLECKARLETLIAANSDDRCGLWRSFDSGRHNRAPSRDPRRRVRSSHAWSAAIAVSSIYSVKSYPLRNGLGVAIDDEKFRRRSNQFAVCRGSRATQSYPPSLHEPDPRRHRCPSRFKGDSPPMLKRGLPGWAGPSLKQGG
jgi:hypothetical protein